MLADGFIALATLALAIFFLLGFRRMELLLIASVIRSLGAGVQTPAVGAIYKNDLGISDHDEEEGED